MNFKIKMKLKYKYILSSVAFLLAGEVITTHLVAMEPEQTSVTKKATLTLIGDRYDVLESYYKDNPNNPDPSVFDHLRKWHDQDFNAIQERIKTGVNRKRLYSYKDVLQNTSLEGVLGFHKLAYAYYLYSIVLTDEIASEFKKNESESEEEDDIQDAIDFIKTGEGSSDELDKLDFLRELGYKCLPFVSQTGHASYRTINRSFGIGIPLLGLPLGRSDYDGNLDKDPDVFYTHDVNHCHFEFFYGEDLKKVFDQYNKLNRIISGIEDKKIQFLCDYFLYEAGHESYLTVDMNDQDRMERHSEDKVTLNGLHRDFQKLFLTKNTFYDFVDRWVDKSLDHMSESKMIIEDFFTKMPGDRGTPIANKIIDKYLATIQNDDDSFEDDFHNEVLKFNTLISEKHYLKQQGFDFDIWKGDRMDFEGMTKFLKDVAQVVKEHVGPKFCTH